MPLERGSKMGSKIFLKINLSPQLFKHIMSKIMALTESINFYTFSDIIMGFNMAYVYLSGLKFSEYKYSVIFLKSFFARCFLKKYNRNPCSY